MVGEGLIVYQTYLFILVRLPDLSKFTIIISLLGYERVGWSTDNVVLVELCSGRRYIVNRLFIRDLCERRLFWVYLCGG